MGSAFFCLLSAFSEYSLSRDWNFKESVLLCIRIFFLFFSFSTSKKEFSEFFYISVFGEGWVFSLDWIGDLLFFFFFSSPMFVCGGKKNTEVWSRISGVDLWNWWFWSVWTEALFRSKLYWLSFLNFGLVVWPWCKDVGWTLGFWDPDAGLGSLYRTGLLSSD